MTKDEKKEFYAATDVRDKVSKALVKLEANWEDPELRADISDKVAVIRNSVDRADRPVDPVAA